ncbi:MAG: hypothetical protein N2Z72_01940 [Bacteroidales bacterium]|nr:hypothetical protein [Bacteroidales bacterium]
MGKQLFVLVFLLNIVFAHAQSIGIGNSVFTPDASSILEVQSSNRGVLLPRVALASVSDNTTIPSPATSLIVYNTGTGGLAPAGYYYNSGTPAAPIWVRMVTNRDAWLLTGNSGTNPTTDFIGTTDNQHLIIRTNNLERMRVRNGGDFIVGGTDPGIAGDLFSVISTATFPHAVNGYTSQDGCAVYGSIFSGNATNFGAVQAEHLGSGTSGALVGIYSGNGPGRALYARRYYTTSSGNGTGYYWSQTRNAVHADLDAPTANNIYYFALHGSTWVLGTTGGRRSGGVLGSHEDNDTYNSWGVLGYLTSGGTNAAVYGTTTYASGTGFMGSQIYRGAGGAFYGDLLGSWSRGELMGTISAGEALAHYNLGNEFTSGFQAQILNVEGDRIVAFTPVTNELKVYFDGKEQLQGGEKFVAFDKNFKKIANKEKLTIVVTPVGEWAALYVAEVRDDGFLVRDHLNPQSNVTFNYVIIAHRVDDKNKTIPEFIYYPDLDEKLKGFLFNENITDRDATPMWWDGKKLRFDPIVEPESHVRKTRSTLVETRMKFESKQ